MSESNQTVVEKDKGSGNAKPRENRVFYTLVGVAVVFAIVVLVNYIAGSVNLRVDLTENKIYTLSDGTKRILSRIDTPITIRYYVTDEAGVMSPAERSQALRISDFLQEYRKAAKGQITIKKLNPEPDTDAEDSARLDGVGPGMSRETGNQVYLGLAIECVDQVEVLPFLAARPETLMEYDLSRAIARVLDAEKAKVVVMTSLKVAGGMSMGGGMMGQQRPEEPWFFYSDMLKDYDVQTIPISSKQIPADTNVLIVLHPYDITDEGQYAIDQYLLAGGKVMALVDPKLFAARFLSPPPNPQMPRPGGPAPSSTLDKLFAAWGVEFKANDVLLDMKYQTQIRGGEYAPTILSFSADALNQEDAITSHLSDIFCIMPGAFLGEPKEGLKKEVLLSSSRLNQLVSSFSADPTQDGNVANMRENYQESGEERALIMRLSGNFASAFPEGDPAAKKDEDKKKTGDKADKKEEPKKAALKKSEKEGVVLLFSDADMIYDQFCVQKQSIMGRTFVQMTNGNISLFQNAVEQMAGDPELINVRSRSSARRPYTKLNEILRKAEAKYMGKVRALEDERRAAEARLNEIQANKPEGQEAILSEQQQEEIESFQKKAVEANKELRQVRKDLRSEFDSLQSLIKVGNTFGVALLVILAGILLWLWRRVRTAAR
ncbi:MAG: GldG family protein [Verrucomicrobiales bacterium]|nr:GldG family protein [Verrucomicrobiales bacterium]